MCVWQNGQYLHWLPILWPHLTKQERRVRVSRRTKMKETHYRMKYLMWYRQFNGFHLCFRLLLFGTEINIWTGIMRIIRTQICTSKQANDIHIHSPCSLFSHISLNVISFQLSRSFEIFFLGLIFSDSENLCKSIRFIFKFTTMINLLFPLFIILFVSQILIKN